jgi:hypothetical protein
MSLNHAKPACDTAADALREWFRAHPVAQLDDLCRALHASGRTVFRVLKRVGYRSSFSHAGRYFTLVDVPRFDQRGLWFHEDVGFSREGTLRSTLVRLVVQAPAGATHEELQATVRLRVHDTLRSLAQAGLVVRELVDALFVYLNANPRAARAQRAERRRLFAARSAAPLPPLDPARVIEVLLAVIRQPRATASQVAASLGTRGFAIDEKQVEETFARYELGKKTARSRSRRSPH